MVVAIDLSFYAFEALKIGSHGDLHITSHRFIEPKAIDLVGKSRTAVAIHGRGNEGSEPVWLCAWNLDAENLQYLRRDASGYQQTIVSLQPLQALPRFWTERSIGGAIIITESEKSALHPPNNLNVAVFDGRHA